MTKMKLLYRLGKIFDTVKRVEPLADDTASYMILQLMRDIEPRFVVKMVNGKGIDTAKIIQKGSKKTCP